MMTQPKSTFQGERGGDAYDAELLALLKGISNKSSASDRFAGGDDEENNESEPAPEPEPEPPKPASKMTSRDPNVIPPWKRGKASGTPTKPKDLNVDIVIAAPPPKRSIPAPSPTRISPEKQGDAPMAPKASPPAVNMTGKSTFQGDRGGDAHDEELLALLRGVSSKASDRFAEDDNDAPVSNATETVVESPTKIPSPKRSPTKISSQKKSSPSRELPPWKRGVKTIDGDVEIVAPTEEPPKTEETIESQPSSKEAIVGGGGNFKQKSNFQGDRGGDAHDEELLALLRGVSAKSSAADRFSGGYDEVEIPPTAVAEEEKKEIDSLPPWKRGKAKKSSQPTVDVVVASKPPTEAVAPPAMEERETPELSQEAIMGGGGDFKKKSNFQGERGGDAHDEELLALLRGVSAKSSSNDRFSGGDDIAESEPEPPAPVAPFPPQQPANELPPWKRGKTAKKAEVTVDVIVEPEAIPAVTKTEEVVKPLSKEAAFGGGGNFQQQSTFQGERGGEAHDEELLALLRGVSAKSSGADRFTGGDTDETPEVANSPPRKASPASPSSSPAKETPSSEKKKKRWKMTPPWKKNKNKKKEQDDDDTLNEDVIVVAPSPKNPQPEAPAIPTEEPSNDEAAADKAPINGGRGNFQQKSTFEGERGGDAHDAELLELLRGASSSRANERKTDVKAPAPMAAAEQLQVEAPIKGGGGNFQQKSTFEGERGGDAHDAELLELLRGASSKSSGRKTTADSQDKVTEAAPAPTVKQTTQGGQGNFKQESTFQGERGGDAHDEELLALLRGVSSSKPSSSAAASPPPKPAAPKPVATPTRAKQPTPSATSSPSMYPSGDAPPEVVLTLEDLPGAFSDKDWKVRKTSYEVLKDSIVERTQKGGAPGSVDSDSIVPDLDNLIPKLFAEKNASGLESAMQAATEYANACRGAASEEQATAMMIALSKGNGLSAPRPASAKAATALVLKIMEVGDTAASLKSVLSILVEKGITAKKPKMVQLSASLILDAIHSFGAVHLPLATITSSLPKVLGNTNKKIRDTGMEIVAELCRSFQSKDPLEGVISKMQKGQVKDLDTLLDKRPDPIPTKIGLRCESGQSEEGGGATSAADIFAALNADKDELEKERFAKRPAVKLMEEIAKTKYASELKEAKWNKKTGALDLVMKCAGEKPYKLAKPSSSNNYSDLISDMKDLLKHTHFAVVSKAIGVLGMLAEGVGEKLYSNLRPLLGTLLRLSKDKKLTKAVSACLDSWFGNILSFEHLLEPDSSLAIATKESKEKNALARTSALEFLERCITRGESAGPRAELTPSNAKGCAKLASQKLDDSDASVRKSALKILTSLQNVEDEFVQSAANRVIEELKTGNPRAYKTLSKTASKPVAKSSIPKASPARPTKSIGESDATSSRARKAPSPAAKTSVVQASKKAPTSDAPAKPKLTRGNSSAATFSADGGIPTYDEALDYCGTLGVPGWDDEPSGDEDDDGGVILSLKSARWQSRRAAINELVGFAKTCPPFDDRSELELFSNSLLIVVKEHTKKFKESNFNVAKCIMELFSALCELHERSQCRLATWAAVDGTSLAVDKIADRKLSSLSKAFLLSLCVVHPPQAVIASACACAEKLRAPLAREEFLNWMKSFCNEFGAKSIGSGIQEIVVFLISECGHKNIKVKRAAFATLGLIHVQLGPPIKAVALSSIKNASLRDDIEKTFEENSFDSSLFAKAWPKSYILANSESAQDGSTEGAGMDVELPTLDLIAELPSDCIDRMGRTDSLTAWKLRKAALEDVENALKRSSGLIQTSSLRPLADLLRTMRERLSDTQSNLKPLAARVIGLVLNAAEGEAQGKLGKVVYGPIMNAAMGDKRKVMNDAAMEALQKGTSIPEINGEGINKDSAEPLVAALTAQLDKSDFKSVGIAQILTFTVSFAPLLSDLHKSSFGRGDSLGDRFSNVLVNALSSSKSDIRSAAESLLSECIANNALSMKSAKKCLGRMVPAKQRTVGMILAKISSSSSASSDSRASEKPSPSRPARMSSRTAPPAEKINTKSMEKSGIQKPQPTPQAAGPKSRLGTYSKPSFEEEVEDPVDDDASHPLVGNPSGMQKSRSAMRSVTWPEYPEEPSGAPLYNGLKKAWSHIIPTNSTMKLFPDRGIRNQSDVTDAFDMVRQAIKMDKEDQGSVVVEQLHFILRWSVFVMGCKESAVGLTGLLDMLSDLLSYLNFRMHEFSDAEVSIFVPFMYERASVAKGRFMDTYMDLIESIKAENLISDKRLGPSVCVPLMEGSSHTKARLMACQTCQHCVEVVGLSGIGKKGVLVAVKAFSVEKLPENRAAFLDLMVLLVSKMNNDMNRFSKICGTALTPKARSLIEEHMKKAPSPATKVSQAKSPSPRKPSRQSRPSMLTPPTKLSFSPKSEFVVPSVFEDELPALDLRRVLRERQSPTSSPTKTSGIRPATFPASAQVPTITTSYSSNLASSSGESSLSEPHPASSPLGAAASLRARLLKIREKNNMGPLPTKPSETIDIPMTSSSVRPAVQHTEEFQTPTFDLEDSILSEVLDSESFLEVFLETIRKLLEKPHKIFESDDDLLSSTDVLKNIHAAVSKQPNLAVMISPIVVENLREEIRERASEVVGLLTRLIRFGFHCHPEGLSAGMSVPLLSVNLASLMAIFRSSDLATLVNVDDLTILIKEAGTALLDPRLAQSAKPGDITLAQIDEATSTQMVRAINKLAVQAATGASRENSIQALIRLQDQLSANSDEDPHFNGRLSRVVTKLSTRVIKAEESTSHPFSSSSMDMETILCFLEDTLDTCRNREQPDGATKHIVKSVVTAILKARRECTSLRHEMEDLEIDSDSSALGELVTSIASDLGLIVAEPRQNTSGSNDVASLVSAVVGASQGAERTAAVDALKSYRAIHGDKELMTHLEDVSPAFRSYLMKELSENPSRASQQRSATDEMSERIKNLRSKLNASESKLSQEGRAQAPSNAPSSKTAEHQQRIKELRQKLNATQAAPPAAVASYPPPTSQSNAGDHQIDERGSSSNPSVSAFRERLAAAKEKQSATKSTSSAPNSPMPATSASSRAAALRARLQAVKMQTQQ